MRFWDLVFFAQCWWHRESVLQGSSPLKEFHTSVSKVLTLWHCVKVKQRYLSNTIEVMNWLSEEEIQKLRNDREFAEAPSCSYYFKPQPDKLGKLIWISGLFCNNFYLIFISIISLKMKNSCLY